MLRIGFGKHLDRWFFRVDLWWIGLRVAQEGNNHTPWGLRFAILPKKSTVSGEDLWLKYYYTRRKIDFDDVAGIRIVTLNHTVVEHIIYQLKNPNE